MATLARNAALAAGAMEKEASTTMEIAAAMVKVENTPPQCKRSRRQPCDEQKTRRQHTQLKNEKKKGIDEAARHKQPEQRKINGKRMNPRKKKTIKRIAGHQH